MAPDWDRLRQKMVEEQLIGRGILDHRVTQAMRSVARHLFVPDSQRKRSYEDRALPIGFDQTISQPFIVGLTLQALELSGPEHVLEVGTGSGYQAALLGHLCHRVVSVENILELAFQAKSRLADLGFDNVAVQPGDGTEGWPKEAPFDAIIVAAASPEIPPPLVEQLKPSGKLVIPLGGRNDQVLTLLQKSGSELISKSLGECRFVPLRGAHGWPQQ